MLGRYVYCIADRGAPSLGKIGILGAEVAALQQSDVSAFVSPVPFREVEASVENIFSHQRVVEAVRQQATTLPVKFGTVFKNEQDVLAWLRKSYASNKGKLRKIEGKDEYGVKAMIDRGAKSRIYQTVSAGSSTTEKMTPPSSPGRGASYLLKIKREEELKRETLRRIDRLSAEIHEELGAAASAGALLATGLDQVILNGAYLVPRSDKDAFRSKVEDLKGKYSAYGLSFHMSGPWAPYSFC